MSAGASKPSGPSQASEPQPPSEAAPTSAPSPATGKMLAMETDILEELRRMNKLLTGITAGPRRYTLAFLSGIARGLGAALGATVIFAILLAVVSRLNTVPLIGTYLRGVIEFIEHSRRAGLTPVREEPSPTVTPAGH